jgi:glycosyltransferase involved in cell wall biosynthesis
MKVVHIAAHLGGGVGKAHAAIRAAMDKNISQTFLLLETPRDRRYADEIEADGAEVRVASSLAEVSEACANVDVVQFEFWNHPRLFECLALADFPAMRSVFWSHVSGLFKPVIQPGFYNAVDRFVFTTPASMALADGLADGVNAKLSVIGSGFGFERSATSSPELPPSALPGISPTRRESDSRLGLNPRSNADAPVNDVERGAARPLLQFSLLVGEMPGRAEGGATLENHPITYLGTVDFIKMSPVFFDAIDRMGGDVSAAIWGSYDINSEVAAKAKAMLHPERIAFMGQTADPQKALGQSSIFFYPLAAYHYGTAENALIEAMSLGLVPVVLANPAECAIVEDGKTGFVAHSVEECAAILDRLLADPDLRRTIGVNAASKSAKIYRPENSANRLLKLWSDVMSESKHCHDFRAVIGSTPVDWYRSTQFLPGEVSSAANSAVKDINSKGTLAHFRSCFPDDPCWSGLN